MNLNITYNCETITFKLIRKLSLKHTYITIQRDGSVVVKANHLISKSRIKNFVLQKASWILKKQALYQQKPLRDIQNIFSKQQAQEVITPLVKKWSEIMNLHPTYIGFRNNKTRWGSCSHKNRLSFNIQLLRLPIESIEYVVVHELAHIEHKNHSREFWNLVEKYLPDFKARQKGLLSGGIFD